MVESRNDIKKKMDLLSKLRTEYTDLASKKFGGKIQFATDEWFAQSENLLTPDEPVFKDGLFTEYGKWMDGWESRRKRIPGHDWCIIKLGLVGKITAIEVNTAFFTGNHSPRVSILGINYSEEPDELKRLEENRNDPFKPSGKMGTCCTNHELELANSINSENWIELVPFSDLQPGYSKDGLQHNIFIIPNEITENNTFTHLRLNMFPDGGIARLRVYGIVEKNWTPRELNSNKLYDLIAIENGGRIIDFSDAHYGHPKYMLCPGRGINMGDGWETARHFERPPILELDNNTQLIKINDLDWSIIRLGVPGEIFEIEIDTIHFKGNFPESCEILGCYQNDNFTNWENNNIWQSLLPRVKLGPDRQFYFYKNKGKIRINNIPMISHIKVIIYPDGGISRIRLLGKPNPNQSMRSKL